MIFGQDRLFRAFCFCAPITNLPQFYISKESQQSRNMVGEWMPITKVSLMTLASIKDGAVNNLIYVLKLYCILKIEDYCVLAVFLVDWK